MKKLFFTAMLWAGIFMPILNAQTTDYKEWSNDYSLGGLAGAWWTEGSFTSDRTDTLRIIAQNRLIMKVTCPEIQTLKKGTRMLDLLEAFRSNLATIQSQIPAYNIYQIHYLKDASLVVEEVEGIVQYQVKNGIADMGVNQSVAHLRDRDLVVSIFFNDIEELSSKKYDKMLGSAFAEMPKPPGRIRENWAPINVYNFSIAQGKMIKRKRRSRSSRRYTPVIPIILSAGGFQNQLIYEVGSGFGVFVGRKKQNFLYGFTSFSYTYDNELAKSKYQELIGLAFSMPRIGVSVAIPYNDLTEDIVYDDIACRIGFSSKAYKNISVNFHQYIEKGFQDIHFGMSVGIGF